MIESNIKEGNQKLTNKQNLVYGQSITDACVDINTTEIMLQNLYNCMQKRFPNSANFSSKTATSYGMFSSSHFSVGLSFSITRG